RDPPPHSPGRRGMTAQQPATGHRAGWRVPLRRVIAATFLFIMFPLSVAMVEVLYWQNSRLAVELAADAMKRASRDALISIQSLLDPVARTVSPQLRSIGIAAAT